MRKTGLLVYNVWGCPQKVKQVFQRRFEYDDSALLTAIYITNHNRFIFNFTRIVMLKINPASFASFF